MRLVDSTDPAPTKDLKVFCKIANVGYALDSRAPSVKAHEAVMLAINDRAFDKPRVIAVWIAD
jgi:hypothetical protein